MEASSRTFLKVVPFLLVVHLLATAALSQGADPNDAEPGPWANRYVFEPKQSTILQTGGFAGVHWTYTIEGQFVLSVDPNAATASFTYVDANAVDETEPLRTLDPNEAFNLMGLTGKVVDDVTIEFTGQAANETTVRLRLTFEDDIVHLTGETIPPPNSADFFILNLDATAGRKYGGGTGEPNHPYQIATAEQMNAIGAHSNDWDKHFQLTADIDLAAYQGTEFRVIGSWHNYPTKGNRPFTGVFDGNGYRILNFTWSSDDAGCIGLFRYVDGPGAEIRNLGLIAPRVEVMGWGSNVGSLVGGLSCGKLVDCYVEDGSIGGYDSVGGLVGATEEGALIKDCYATGTVTGAWGTGGLVGLNQGLITNCRSVVTVTGEYNAGGLVGRNEGGTMTSCYASGNVTGSAGVGGFVGQNAGSIVGSYSTGSVRGQMDVGGLAGNNWGHIAMSYSAGTVAGDKHAGGLVGFGAYPITAGFWDVETSGQTTSGGGVGLTTAQMQDMVTFLSEGWDFVDESGNGTCDYWRMSPDDYPRLRCLSGDRPVMPEGLGTREEPHLIRDARDLGTVWFEPLAHYRLATSIDLSDVTWSVAVIPWFGGSFEGDGCVISNLHIQGNANLGLFGRLGSGAEVSYLGLEAVDVNGAGIFAGASVGGLAGSNLGRIITSYCTGTVSGGIAVGGLVGWSDGAAVEYCYSTAAVSGGVCVGGLLGCNAGAVGNCYATGSVTGMRYVGGLIGENGRKSGGAEVAPDDRVLNCYSAGPLWGNEYVGGLIGMRWEGWGSHTCFWDVESSLLATSGGKETGLTTAEMQTASTFIEAGWDFVGEGANGTDDIWWILEGVDYPRLWWESADAEF